MSANTAAACGILLFIVGLAAGNRPATLGGAYVALAAWLAAIYAKSALGHIRYRRMLGSPSAFVGDNLTLKIQVENRKPLPVFWLACEDEVPGRNALEISDSNPHWRPERAVLRNVTYLKWFERVEREFSVRCLRRGVFTFGPVRISSGDVMGFREASTISEEHATLTVYPRMADVQGIHWDEDFPFGDSPSRGWMNPDPLTIAGARAYSIGTPLRQIAWRATARTGEMQEKLLEPTRQRNIVVALSLTTGERFWEGVNPGVQDEAVFICASLCRWLFGRGTPFGLAANALGARSGRRSLMIQPGSSRAHLRRVMGALARVSVPWMEFYGTLRSLPRETEPDTSIVVVLTRQLTTDWNAVLELARFGRSVSVVVLRHDERFASNYRTVPTYVPAAPVDWRTAEVIAFERVG